MNGLTSAGVVALGILAARGVFGFVQDYKYFRRTGGFTWKSLITYWKQSIK